MNEYNIVSSIPSCVWTNGVAINDRIDSMYYRSSSIKDYQKIKKFSKIRRVSNYFDVSKLSGFEYTDYFTEESLKSGTVIALTSQNVMENQINFDNIIKIPFEIHNSLERSKIYPNDILLSYTGQYRRACTAPQNIELHLGPNICRLRSTKLIDVHYVSTFLNCRYGQSSLDREKTMSAQPTVNMSRIRDILLPIPSPDIQKYIGNKVRKAEELREEAKRLKKEAEEVLSEKLNVKELLLKINKYTEKHNWINDSDINDRMDALYYNPQKTIIRRFYKKYDLRKLNTLVDYKKGFAFKSEDYCHSSTNTFLLRVSDISNNEVNMDNMIKLSDKFYQEYIDFNLFNEDIVMVVTGNTTGKSVIINNSKSKLLLNQNAIRMRLKDGTNVSTYYIELILQSQYFQTLLKYSLYQSVQPFISMEFLNEVKIPIIDKIEREDISNLYKKSLNNLFYSKQLIQEAKQDVEDLIEGNFDMSKIKVNN